MSFDFSEPKEADPTADFLAREREAAGVLSGDADLFGSGGGAGPEGDFERNAASFPALDEEGVPASNTGFGAFDDDEPPKADGEREQFEQSFPELDDEPAQRQPSFEAPSTNGFAAPPANNNTYTAPAPTYESDGEDPEPVRKWREQQQDAIAQRDAAAERKKGEAISKAERDIDNFYSEYNAKKEKNIAANKEAEAKFQEERTRELAEGTTWSRVTKVLELQNSQSKTIARGGPGSTDLTRMKDIYLSLRREGETAPGASGY